MKLSFVCMISILLSYYFILFYFFQGGKTHSAVETVDV